MIYKQFQTKLAHYIPFESGDRVYLFLVQEMTHASKLLDFYLHWTDSRGETKDLACHNN